jgi:alpha-beta hydrolase superfamily lysophospholipase
VVPESRRVPRESLFAQIDFKKAHAPLLLIAGSEDHIIPAALNRTNYKKYRNAGSQVAFKEFAGRNHFTIGQDRWEEVAQYVEAWINRIKV